MTSALPTAAAGLITPALIEAARQRAAVAGSSVLSALANITAWPDESLTRCLAQWLNWQSVDLGLLLSDYIPAFDRVSLARAMRRGGLLLRDSQASLCALMCDPFDADLMRWLSAEGATRSLLCTPADLHAFLQRHETSARAMDSVVAATAPNPDSATTPVLSFTSVDEQASPIVKLVDSTLYDALKSRASDIHLEATASGLAIRYRIDGVLDPATSLPGVALAEQTISRLKVLAGLDIAESRVPQDGSFRVAAQGRDIDLRVSIMPSIHGEDAVIRILDKQAMIAAYGALSLTALGFDSATLHALRRLAEAPYGMLLVTGPTGSGKTTTLYAALSEIHHGRDKIITIEDPVEYQLPGILQIPVNDRKGLSFARGLRSILRHDPDKIMVGEIRDRETAEIAVQSALTGHLVLTTVHANNAFDVFSRFAHMGIDPYAFVSSLNGVAAQRLVRSVCEHCAREHAPNPELLAHCELKLMEVAHYRFRTGVGCDECRGTGYHGRRAIAEVLLLNDTLRELIIEQAPLRALKQAAALQGMRGLRDAALELVCAGTTTLTEVRRVTLHA